ncbi:hypothetical protein [Methylobacterium sp. WL19]|uniref:hypothetical protein n=1 Tax=Methylobacterium sp. WL19 TaxID=2603896 RepID=UPI0011CC2271|nr:hypothetical protein [Methylobacterium sp. WL19]TXN33906.1 hypothetical protein FV220_00200 [Methylobacterium sp. WL19]
MNTVTEAREVVSVACKLPSGFIMREFTPQAETELVLGGGSRDVTVHRETGRQVVVKGVAYRFGSPPPVLVNGYRITRDVPKDLWDNWYEANKASDLVRNHIVYADVRHDDVKAWGRDHEAAPSGFEGIDPDGPNKRVRGIERADRPK